MVYIPEPPPALFSREDVERRIVMLEHVVPDARDYFRRLRELGYRRRKLKEGDSLGPIERSRLTWLTNEIERLTERVESCVDDVELVGGNLVDIEAGEVTFATLIDLRPAYYVWTPGDAAVLWFRFADEPVGQAHLLDTI